MRLLIENIGLIKSTSIELDGITVLAGKNDTGKSTVSKSLYSTFNSLSQIDSKVRNERKINIRRVLMEYIRANGGKNSFFIHGNGEKYFKRIDSTFNDYAYSKINETEFKELISDIDEMIQHDELGEPLEFNSVISVEAVPKDDVFNSINQTLQLSDEKIYTKLSDNLFKAEFNGQINNVSNSSTGKIELEIKENQVVFNIINNTVQKIENPINLNHSAIYIDNPFILDEVRSELPYFIRRRNIDENHVTFLINQLTKENKSDVISQLKIDDKLHEIHKKIDEVASGTLQTGRDVGYRTDASDVAIHPGNLSAGLKTFIIIKRLLENETLKKNGTIILDEPEIHLHPEWQVLFAEIIVMIQQAFDMHILLTTHSPYFLYAIEVFTARYNIENKTNYYLSSKDSGIVTFTNVNNSVDKIYQMLSEPFQKLEDLRYE